ncbi:protein-methionine-sulfoxide reductase heme-binding subunit MsrQ [Vibrio sp. S17_S38]|uniref:protein-methionine-sulfoxide reductase heme-binding subunit MsrQ n=1 Tax=Vibrio sp. S17_S38 TaxID=2720229 RepID=UPI00167FF771|nr:protein-methionine-sulfoxide reductase heme-binding subunit MsrQ [Vibrio sp. S17_S38]MBD1573539.1 protein-methionine-sulfoxide reductase heme-binding subunit MsrQ [Vibrio sp. S17_S38]
MTLTPKHTILIKIVIHLGHIFAFVWLFFAVTNGYLGADPVEPIIHFTGKAAINSLLITLLVTPIVQKLKLGALVRVRRLLGVYSFAWAFLHLSSFAWLDLALEWQLLGSEIIKRPYLVVGALVWIILFLLTLTSTQSMQRKLGKKWQQLHNWVYIAAILAPIHYYWSVKSGVVEPIIYLIISFILLSLRRQKIKRWLNIKTAK